MVQFVANLTVKGGNPDRILDLSARGAPRKAAPALIYFVSDLHRENDKDDDLFLSARSWGS